MRNSLVALTIAIAVLAGGVAGYGIGNAQTTTTTQMATQYSTATSTITNTATRISTVFTGGTPAAPVVFGIENWNVTISGYNYAPNFLTFNPASNLIYLSGAPSNVVTIVSAKTHNVTSTFSVPGIYVGPISIDPKTNILVAWVDTCNNEPNATDATCNPNNIEVTADEINATTDAIIRVFPNPGFYAVDFATSTLYETRNCPNPNGSIFSEDFPNCGFVYSYNLESGSLVSNITLGEPIFDIAVNPETNMVYAEASRSLSSYQILTINGTSNLVEANTSLIFLSSTPVLRINVNTNTLFALGASGSTLITAINGTTGRIIYSSTIGSGCLVNSNRYYVNPLTNQIYATAWNGTAQTNYLLIINASTGHLQNMLSTEGYDYEDSTSNPQSNQIYLLLSGQLVSLPAQFNQTYTNASLLSDSSCFDYPV